MSTNSSDSAIVAQFQQNFTFNTVVYVSTTLACYEHLLGLKYEYLLLRQMKWTATTWMFLCNRYFLVLTSVLTIAAPFGPKGCDSMLLQCFLVVLSRLPGFIAAVFSALRTFVLSDRNNILTGIVLVLGTVPLITNLPPVIHASFSYVDDPVLGPSCYESSGLSPSGAFYTLLDLRWSVPPLIPGIVSLFTRLAVIVGEIIVILVTWVKTFQQVKATTSLNMQSGSMSSTLLRDGSLYFLALLILNIAQLLVTDIPRLQEGSPVAPISNTVQSVLLSRFIMNLRSVHERHDASDTTSGTSQTRPAQLSTVNFRPTWDTAGNIMGPIGDDLDYGEHIQWYNQDEDTTHDNGSVEEHVVDDIEVSG